MEKKVSQADKLYERLSNEILISESYLCGLFYGNTELYSHYSDEQLNSKTFFSARIGFYFGIGRHLFDKGIVVFDDITVANAVNELGLQSKYEAYGSYDGINEIVLEVVDKRDNIDGYYEEVKKYSLIRNLIGLFGSKVVESTGKYDYKKMTKEQLQNYWLDKVNKLTMDGDNRFVEGNLLKGLEDDIERWDKEPDIGLEFYKSKWMTGITNGFAKGIVYINGGFGGRGKTSFVFNKVIMSHIVNKVKLLVIANEEDIEAFKKMLLITVMGAELHSTIQRQRINEGAFTDKEREKLNKALEWIREISDGDDSTVKFVFMEHFTMENCRKVITHYALRGYESVIVDTQKPSDSNNGMERWAQFADDFKELHRIIKSNTGLNLRCLANVQLADTAMTSRYLDYNAFAESKKIKNEASVVFMSRPLWDDEYHGGKSELKCYKFVPREEAEDEDPFSEHKMENVNGKPYTRKEFTLKRKDEHGNQQQFYLMFTPKNRRSRDNNTGLDIMVFKVNFNSNDWQEYAWTTVVRDHSY